MVQLRTIKQKVLNKVRSIRLTVITIRRVITSMIRPSDPLPGGRGYIQWVNIVVFRWFRSKLRIKSYSISSLTDPAAPSGTSSELKRSSELVWSSKIDVSECLNVEDYIVSGPIKSRRNNKVCILKFGKTITRMVVLNKLLFIFDTPSKLRVVHLDFLPHNVQSLYAHTTMVIKITHYKHRSFTVRLI